jgi:peptide/nickel transport system substrate-binding protein
MQWADAAFGDVRFRKALNISIDRDAIIKHLFAGMAKPVDCYLGKDILSCGGDPTLKPYPYAPEEAKKLIKEGGYDGYKFKIASYSRSGLPEYSKLVEAAAGYWQKIGLKPEIVMTDYDAFRKRWESKKSENWVCGFDSASSPGCSEVISRLWKKFHSSENRSVTNLPEIDAMLDKASTSLNPNEVPGIIKKFHQFEYNNYLTIPICNINEDMATTKRIPKWDPGNRRRDRNFIDIIKQ